MSQVVDEVLAANKKYASSFAPRRTWHSRRRKIQDVRRIREHPLVAKHIPIYGYTYDVHSGNLVEVTEATEAGRAR